MTNHIINSHKKIYKLYISITSLTTTTILQFTQGTYCSPIS